jgi:peptidyl-prolyl cis-trans isomerase C
MYYSRKRNSKKIFFVVTIIAACVFVAANFLIKQTPNEVTVAKVNGQKIFKSEVERKLHDIFDSESQTVKTPEINKLPKEVLEILIKEVYLEKELAKEAAKSKIAKNQEILAKIADAKNKILRQAYIDDLTKAEVNDASVNNKYLELSKELDGKKEYSISHIVVKTEETANKVLKELTSSKSTKFSDLAKKYSIDEESSNKGGSLDYILEDNMIKEIAEVATTLKINEVSKPIQTKFGWHLIKVSDVRDAQSLPFEAVKESIKNQLTQDVVNKINSKITNNAKIEILISLQEPDKADEAASEVVDPNAIVAEEEVAATQEASTEQASTEKEEATEKKSEVKTEEKKSKNDSKTKSDAKDKKTKSESKKN